MDSIRHDAGTCDEFEHLASGYALLRHVDQSGRLWDPVGLIMIAAAVMP